MSTEPLPNDPEYLKAALSQLGLKEIPGPKHEKRVVAMYAASGHPEVKNDETAWCAAFVGWALKMGGLPNTGSLMARSYAKYGKPVNPDRPVPRGAIAVWPRGAPSSGHVNFVLEDKNGTLTCVDGNVRNSVTITKRARAGAVAIVLPPGTKQTPAVKPKPKPKPPEPAPEPEVVPAPPPPDIEPTPPPAPKIAWYERIWLKVVGVVTTIGGAIYDYRVALTIIGGLLLGTIGFIWFMGPDRVRRWIRKQFNNGSDQ